MHVIVVAGARPNFIKIGPLMPALAAAGIDAGIAHTGQHYDSMMSDVFFSDLEIPSPRWNLEVGSGSHAQQTGIAMMRLAELFEAQDPDCIIVVGDVNSTLAGALAAVKLNIPVIHLEAGLRSWDPSMPEEVNRVLTDRIASLLLVPSLDADANLVAEGADPARVRFVGNIMAESLLRHREAATARDAFATYGLSRGEYILSTCHRPENVDDPVQLTQILAALESAPKPVLLLAHPRTREAFDRLGIGIGSSNVIIAQPVGYLDMLSLQESAAVIVTDSGGIQEESCMLGVPCVTVRRNTERPITVALGANRVVAARRDAIAGGIEAAISSPRGWSVPEKWDLLVSERVASVVKDSYMHGFPPFERLAQ